VVHLAITNINSIQIKNCIVDEIHIRRSVDASVNLTSSKDTWQIDTYLLARFLNNLEAGTIDNGGLHVTQFAIKRRKLSEINSITLGYVPYQLGVNVSYTDYTQANDSYIYSIVPVGENGLEGVPNEIQIDSNFTGWFIVDKDTNNILSFDKAMGNVGEVNTTLNQGRIEIKKMTKYPDVYYLPEGYHSFTLTTTIIPSEWERSGAEYTKILNNFITNPKPFLAKSSSGKIFVVDVSNPKVTEPLNTWDGFDYFTLSLDCVEIMSTEDYMKS
jgi:hypothetical protein